MHQPTPDGPARALVERARPIGPSDRILTLEDGRLVPSGVESLP